MSGIIKIVWDTLVSFESNRKKNKKKNMLNRFLDEVTKTNRFVMSHRTLHVGEPFGIASVFALHRGDANYDITLFEIIIVLVVYVNQFELPCMKS